MTAFLLQVAAKASVLQQESHEVMSLRTQIPLTHLLCHLPHRIKECICMGGQETLAFAILSPNCQEIWGKGSLPDCESAHCCSLTFPVSLDRSLCAVSAVMNDWTHWVHRHWVGLGPLCLSPRVSVPSIPYCTKLGHALQMGKLFAWDYGTWGLRPIISSWREG